ncbi:hypothetical protein ACFOYW_13200 [Gryllotalpicola reticulitermitis]|uniref:Uncharacterized protein n=1 Tax=Gryllotalpicola reticulitermitis TaxID=1184153 RepID=A0ABV8Q7M3_9MICO
MSTSEHPADAEPVLVQIEDGSELEIRNRYGERRTVRVGREWELRVGDEVVGHISYAMLTRERRSPGKRYVNARWQSPGWRYRESGDHHWLERPSRKECVESLMWALSRRRAAGGS